MDRFSRDRLEFESANLLGVIGTDLLKEFHGKSVTGRSCVRLSLSQVTICLFTMRLLVHFVTRS